MLNRRGLWINIGFTIASALIFGIGLLTFFSTQNFIRSSRWVGHAQSARTNIASLSSTFFAAQTNIRGFVLTGDQHFLQQHIEARRTIQSMIRAIRVDLADTPSQRKRLDELVPLLEERIRSWENIASRPADETVNAYRRNIRNPELRGYDARIGSLLKDIDDNESYVIEARTARTDVIGSRIILVVVLGTPIAIFLILGAARMSKRDLQLRMEAEAESRKAREHAEEAARAKAQFLANMSHEIRTPLNGIIGVTDLILETSLDEQQKKYARIIQDSGAGLLNVVNDILDFSKIDAGKLTLENIAFDPVHVVETQADLLATKAREKGLSLMTHVDPAIPTRLKGDPGRISQVILNLVSNAIKFTPSGSITVRAKLEQDLDTHVVLRFSVQDTGIGISSGTREALFKPFSQADGSTARKYGGTGLGLSICKRLTAMMNGAIGVDSEVDHGSNFWFTCRLERAPGEAVAHKLASERSGVVKKVLVVDDDLASREIVSSYLATWGMKADAVADAETALRKIRSEAAARDSYDVIIIDKRMPAVDGFQLAAAIQEDPQLSSARLILMTAFDRADQAEAAAAAGFRAYLTKPIRQTDLVDGIRIACRESPAPVAGEAPVTGAARPVPDRGKDSILLVEDNAVNQMLALTQLRKLGYTAHAVTNGREAIEVLQRTSYDLVLMDCQMPEMDGFEATRRIRQQEAGKGTRIPIIALTANALEEDERRCLEAGMDDYLPKPIRTEKLARVLDRWFRDIHSRAG